MVRKLLLACVMLAACLTAAAQTPSLTGAWKALTYEIAGVPHPMTGLFLFTDRYYSSNILFHLAAGPNGDANGNAGPYELQGDQIIFEQWVQVHVRPEDSKHSILARSGEPEHATLKLEGDRMILRFPSGNRFFLERVK